MTALSRHGGVGVPFGRRGSAPSPGSPLNPAVLWRAAVLIAIPLLVWAVTEAVYQRIPQTAAGLRYDVVVNRITGAACIQVKNAPTPPSLADLSCK